MTNTMTNTTKISLALAALLMSAASPALARGVAGVDVPETLSAEGKTLKLNGAGIRKKFIIKVYVGALYLENTATSAQEIVKSDQVKVVQMHFLRDVDKEKIIGAYKEGFEKNSGDKVAQLQAGLDKLKAGLADMKEGGVMTVTYAPGKGTTVAIKGGPSVSVPGKEFADALLRNWVGSEPADGGLKEAMLAGK